MMHNAQDTHLLSLINASICSPSFRTYNLSLFLKASKIGSTSTGVPLFVLGSIVPEALEDASAFILREEFDDVELYDGDATMGLGESERSVRKSGALILGLVVAASPDAVAMFVGGDPDEGL